MGLGQRGKSGGQTKGIIVGPMSLMLPMYVLGKSSTARYHSSTVWVGPYLTNIPGTSYLVDLLDTRCYDPKCHVIGHHLHVSLEEAKLEEAKQTMTYMYQVLWPNMPCHWTSLYVWAPRKQHGQRPNTIWLTPKVSQNTLATVTGCKTITNCCKPALPLGQLKWY